MTQNWLKVTGFSNVISFLALGLAALSLGLQVYVISPWYKAQLVVKSTEYIKPGSRNLSFWIWNLGIEPAKEVVVTLEAYANTPPLDSLIKPDMIRTFPPSTPNITINERRATIELTAPISRAGPFIISISDIEVTPSRFPDLEVSIHYEQGFAKLAGTILVPYELQDEHNSNQEKILQSSPPIPFDQAQAPVVN